MVKTRQDPAGIPPIALSPYASSDGINLETDRQTDTHRERERERGEREEHTPQFYRKCPTKEAEKKKIKFMAFERERGRESNLCVFEKRVTYGRCACGCKGTRMYVCVHLCVWDREYVCVRECVYVCVHLCVWDRESMCVRESVCICVYM